MFIFSDFNNDNILYMSNIFTGFFLIFVITLVLFYYLFPIRQRWIVLLLGKHAVLSDIRGTADFTDSM